MFIIDKHKNVKLTRADTATMLVDIYDMDGNKYKVKPNDIIRLTIKYPSAATAALVKEADSTQQIVINSSDTENLAFGLYNYQVELITEGSQVFTVIPTSFWEITEELD